MNVKDAWSTHRRGRSCAPPFHLGPRARQRAGRVRQCVGREDARAGHRPRHRRLRGPRRRRPARSAARHAGHLADGGRDPGRQLGGDARQHRGHSPRADGVRQAARRASDRSRSSASPIARRSCATTPPVRKSWRTASARCSPCPTPARRCSTRSSRSARASRSARKIARRWSWSPPRTPSSARATTPTCSKGLAKGGAMMHAVVLTSPSGSSLDDAARNRAHVLDRGPQGQRRHPHRHPREPGLRRRN